MARRRKRSRETAPAETFAPSEERKQHGPFEREEVRCADGAAAIVWRASSVLDRAHRRQLIDDRQLLAGREYSRLHMLGGYAGYAPPAYQRGSGAVQRAGLLSLSEIAIDARDALEWLRREIPRRLLPGLERVLIEDCEPARAFLDEAAMARAFGPDWASARASWHLRQEAHAAWVRVRDCLDIVADQLGLPDGEAAPGHGRIRAARVAVALPD